VTRSLALPLLALALSACTAGDPPASAASVAASASADDAVARVGDITMHASVMQTSSLNEGVAKDYGIARSDNTVLLLIAVRKGADAQETALPATITATATDLAGRTAHRQPARLRRQRGDHATGYATLRRGDRARGRATFEHAVQPGVFSALIAGVVGSCVWRPGGHHPRASSPRNPVRG
jgi:hypothetical protein